MIKEKKIIEFSNELDSKTPTPGGGAAAAVCGSLAASLGGMVSKYSINKKGLEDYEKVIEEALENFLVCKERLLELADEDVKAYQKFKEALKSKDKKLIEEATKNSIETAYKIAKCGYEILNNSYMIAKYGNQNLLSDAIITGYYAWATMQSGLTLVKDNLNYLKDDDYKESFKEEIKEFIVETDNLINKIRNLSEEKNHNYRRIFDV
ncbi:Formiminotetrahydrofolate cyclodeaminase [Marinitoga hydrogenitolerans DSM 16785]|uniref:Formiminotetrahydrofolate cyclodeaminase n=1 Tax=Marinitoga hydrogenitolerans (strain DSM 16785 / JCM 12826 / AT1271) TaxID=1122195 RepID=A0A1M4SL36_MARH1|nr:cyclodeaminase/cyclohydrolase family protein [Marinitoga hydrogenitolerans]SHE32920.1 Formiminotetrahydrofolate cyclodeaminase [Marinitoga hydrogenitolerans DSM 16785]